MARIESIETGYYRVPLLQELTDSTHGVMRDFELITVRIRDADAAEGVGYTFTVGRNGGAIANIIEREMAPALKGKDADATEAIWNLLWWDMHYGGRGGPTVLAQSAVDIALWDLKAKRLNQPLWKLLGGFTDRVPCYAGGIDLNLPLPQLLEQTDRNLDRGFRAIKMKVGRKRLSEDVERVSAMRSHLGRDFPLMVDANMKWSADEAIRAGRAFAPYDLTWLEEPIAPDDVAGHVRVVREAGLPIAAGENLRTIWDFRHLIASGGVTYPEPDVTNCGGITNFMKIAHLAEAFNLPVTSHGAHDVTVHLLAAVPNHSYLEAHGFGLDEYIAEPLRITDGRAVVPSRPGHGIQFDWQRLGSIREQAA
jgi:L-alanine-DL-glutamate epimerase-like enolase superfamily enzyme